MQSLCPHITQSIRMRRPLPRCLSCWTEMYDWWRAASSWVSEGGRQRRLGGIEGGGLHSRGKRLGNWGVWLAGAASQWPRWTAPPGGHPPTTKHLHPPATQPISQHPLTRQLAHSHSTHRLPEQAVPRAASRAGRCRRRRQGTPLHRALQLPLHRQHVWCASVLLSSWAGWLAEGGLAACCRSQHTLAAIYT